VDHREDSHQLDLITHNLKKEHLEVQDKNQLTLICQKELVMSVKNNQTREIENSRLSVDQFLLENVNSFLKESGQQL